MSSFEARIDAMTIKRIFEAFKDIVDVVMLNVSARGLSMQAMDNSHVSLVRLDLQATSFDHFRCDADMAIGIKIASFIKVLNFAQKEGILTLFSKSGSSTLDVLIESASGAHVSTFSQHLMDVDVEDLGVPDIEHDVRFSISSVELHRLCKELSSIGDTMSMKATNKCVTFTASGHDVDSASVAIRTCGGDGASNDECVRVEHVQDIERKFALKYVMMFAKAFPLSDVAVITMKSDTPLMVRYNIDEYSTIDFYLAPKIED